MACTHKISSKERMTQGQGHQLEFVSGADVEAYYGATMELIMGTKDRKDQTMKPFCEMAIEQRV